MGGWAAVLWGYDRRAVWLTDIRAAPARRVVDMGAAVLLLGLATVVMLAVRTHLNILSVALIFLVLVVIIATFADRWVSVAASFVAFVLFDYFFVLPYYSLDVAAADHVLALVVFLGTAAVISQLVYRVRMRTIEALARGRQMEILFDLSQALIADVTLAGMLSAIAERVADVLGTAACAILLVDEQGQPVVHAAVGPPPPIEDRDHQVVALWALEHRRPAGLGQRRSRHVLPHGSRSQTRRSPLPSRDGASLYVPIGVPARVSGLLYVSHVGSRQQFSSEDQHLLQLFANQIALALERVRLGEEATRAAVLARSDELKSALLSAVSHDLRTPLASIKASATSLLQPDIDWSPNDQRDLLIAIDEETDRLTRLVRNLLDLTRIEAGALRPQTEWNDPEEVIRETVARAGGIYPRHEIRVQLPAAVPLVMFDYVEIAQVLINLIENAGKFAPPETTIDISCRLVPGAIEFAVADRGPGIPAGEEEAIFGKFYRIGRSGGPQGAGIGLSVCRGIVEAHGGRIWAEPREGGGAVFRFALPRDADRLATCESVP
ncbi:MAG TPA: ATP-binding protein [Thermomicrobiales bacterium]|nr:ATP-binding protein [Thermomicrobiales bacterium]